MWTLLLNLLSKLQSVALLICGYHVAGFAGIGVLTTAVGASYLASSAADFGLSNEIARVVAGRPFEQTIRTAGRAGVVRVPIALVVSPLAFWLTVGRHAHASWVAYVGMAAFAATLLASTELIAGIGGLGNFAVPTQLVGACRAASSVVAVMVVYAAHSPASVLLSFAGGELVGVVLCLVYLRRYSFADADNALTAQLSRQHLWLGAAAVVNVLTNQSDTVLVAAILSPTQLGIFSIASQLQNGVATLALSPASPMTVHAARAAAEGILPVASVNHARRLTLRLAITLVALIFGAAALLANAVTKLQPLSTHVGITTLLLCLLAAIPSAVSGIYFAVAVGFKEHRRVGIGRLSGGLASATVIVALAEAFRLVGAASGTLIRDLVALAIAYRIAAPHLREGASETHVA
jgi:O-antigen/teichoic acid export membrane protein